MDCSFKLEFSEVIEFNEFQKDAMLAFDKVLNKTGQGHEFLGWVTLPETYDRVEYERMKELSSKVKKSDILIVVGVGGSFLGSKAVIDALSPYFKKGKLDIVFAGNGLSGNYLNELIEYIEDKDFYINVISKSGTTFETALSFRILKEICEKKYGINSKDRIIVTTDSSKGLLKKFSKDSNYETFVVPDDVGGRFSVLSAVGLFPIMCAGIDTDALILGACDGMEEFTKRSMDNNCIKYAILRNYLNSIGKELEYLVVNEPKLKNFQEWWKQLFSESEGKNGKGLYTESAEFTKDLHSFGQMIQDGNKIIFETIVEIENLGKDVYVPKLKNDFDKLNYLSDKSLNKINNIALEATKQAHIEGNVPSIKLTIPKLDTYNLGKLIYFFEMSCAISAYLLGVNPFNQPGVENYKKNMRELLKTI